MTSAKCGGALEIDLVVQRGNRIDMAEVKSGNKARERRPIEQPAVATEHRSVGTHVAKFLILDRSPERNNYDLARAHKITRTGAGLWIQSAQRLGNSEHSDGAHRPLS